MVASRHRRERKAPQGLALAFLAVAVQLLLPFLVAVEIAAASSPAAAETTTLCLAAGSTGAGATHDSQTGHHGLASGCPLCITLAASQAFTAPAPMAAPPPLARHAIAVAVSSQREPSATAPAFYRSRAPPTIA